MMLSQADIQAAILVFIKAKHPELQTHASVAAALPWLGVNSHPGSNTVHQVAMNMDRMSKDGILWIDPSRGTEIKHYGVPG